jgi:hypothetical protein
VSLRYGADATVSYLVAFADGLALQALSDRDRDYDAVIAAGRAAAGSLLRAE